jgi:hypothetical protein
MKKKKKKKKKALVFGVSDEPDTSAGKTLSTAGTPFIGRVIQKNKNRNWAHSRNTVNIMVPCTGPPSVPRNPQHQHTYPHNPTNHHVDTSFNTCFKTACNHLPDFTVSQSKNLTAVKTSNLTLCTVCCLLPSHLFPETQEYYESNY